MADANPQAALLWRLKRKEILFEQVVALVSRIASGVVLIALGYVVLETYRHKAAYDNQYSEHRLERLTSLWTATDRHGVEVLKALADEKGGRALSARLQSLGETYYLELAAAGLFLGQERLVQLSSSIGDIYLSEQEPILAGGSTIAKAIVLKEFRANWISALQELELLGEKSGR